MTKKSTVIVISLVVIAIWGAIVFTGFNRIGTSDEHTHDKLVRAELQVPFRDEVIDLSKGLGAATWNSITSSIQVELMHQVMVL